MEAYDLSKLTADDFRNHLHQNIEIYFNPEIPVNMEVLEVQDLELYSPLERNSFSILFRMNGEKGYYPQGTYPVNHPELGKMDIFLVPLGADKEGMRYQSIFS
ncbi:DUF6916 family protein [Dyadobacter subterraneus]|uniref:DUF6916 domain-containing protein n=1 Tax=Dyadobacter subterraneus TaxID=2773304 RepID=A0ABR9WC36_9BACT|nr:hypothetical protein [Dyadobacter subterraneus]MBE9461794.1 hypothetical protein [Dyadobacter subterraneus]